jgi:integrase
MAGLTKKRIERLRHHPGRHRDTGAGSIKGLYLLVRNPNAVSWLLRYQVGPKGDAKESWMGLGSLSEFTLEEVRVRAKAARQLLRDGHDPIEHRRATRDAARKEAKENITFKEAAEKFLALYGDRWRSNKHRLQWERSVKRYAYPLLGGRPCRAIETALINEALAPIWTKTPVTAARVRDRIQKVLKWVKDGMPLPARSGSQVKHYGSMPYSELPLFLPELRAGRRMTSSSALALEFLILTASRTNETLAATWDEIKLDEAVWIIPGERMKMGKEHRVPLSGRALQLLRSLPVEQGNPYLFVGRRVGKGLSPMAMLELLRGIRPGVVTHGFRSTFRTWAAECTNFAREVCEAALAHKIPDKVEATYQRGDLFEKRRRLMDAWANFCTSPPAAADIANVVPIRA